MPAPPGGLPGGMPAPPVAAPSVVPAVSAPSMPSATRSPMSRSTTGVSATYSELINEMSRLTPLVNKLARILGIPARDVYDFLHVLDQLQESYESGLLEVVDRMKEQRSEEHTSELPVTSRPRMPSSA